MYIQHQLACLALIASNYLGSISAGFASLGSLSISPEDHSSGHLIGGQFGIDLDTHDSLGSLGDHLDEHHFPADIESGLYKGSDSGILDYGEASHISEYDGAELLGHERKDVHFNDLSGQHYSHGRADLLYGELEHKAVRGIDHGKGAFSYSTSYETKDHK